MEQRSAIYFRYGALEVWRVYQTKDDRVVVHVGATSRTELDTVTTPLLPGFALNNNNDIEVRNNSSTPEGRCNMNLMHHHDPADVRAVPAAA